MDGCSAVRSPGEMPGASTGPYSLAQLCDRDVAGTRSVALLLAGMEHLCSVSSVDDSVRNAMSEGGKGGKVIAEPLDVASAGRMAVLADRQGAASCMGSQFLGNRRRRYRYQGEGTRREDRGPSIRHLDLKERRDA